MTLKGDGGGFDKTIKGNSNIFGIQTSGSDCSKYKEFDDLDDDEEDQREQSDEEEEATQTEHCNSQETESPSATTEEEKQIPSSGTKDELDHQNDPESGECISDSGSTSSNHQN